MKYCVLLVNEDLTGCTFGPFHNIRQACEEAESVVEQVMAKSQDRPSIDGSAIFGHIDDSVVINTGSGMDYRVSIVAMNQIYKHLA